MKAIKGKSSNFTTLSNLLNKCSSFYETHQFNSFENLNLNLLRIRLFSSFDSHSNRSRQGRRTGRNDFNDGDGDDDDDDNNRDDKFSGRSRQGYNAGRNGRGDRERGQFGGNEPDYRSRGRRNDGFGKRVGGEKGRGDDVFKFDDNGEGSEDYQPSVRQLLKGPVRGKECGGEGGDEFLEKFKLGGEGEGEGEGGSGGGVKEEGGCDGGRMKSSPVEEKVEATQDADEIFSKMKKNGLISNAVAMLDGLCHDGLVHEAMKLFGVMRERGTMPEVVVYTAVVEGFCQARKLDDAKRVFKKMQDNGIVPNAFSYGVLVKGLCKAKRLEEAADVCVEMLEAGHSPNVRTFTDLVHEFCKEKGLEDAQKVILALKQKGFFLDEKAVRVYLDKSGPTSPVVWEAIFGPKKTSHKGGI
ncbi:hypothetical protein vseg_008491 [Gypsophila vaccaria]